MVSRLNPDGLAVVVCANTLGNAVSSGEKRTLNIHSTHCKVRHAIFCVHLTCLCIRACLRKIRVVGVGNCILNVVVPVDTGLNGHQYDSDHPKHQQQVVGSVATKLVSVGPVHGDIMFIPALAKEQQTSQGLPVR